MRLLLSIGLRPCWQTTACALVLKEAMVNSTTRVPFERNVALVLEELPPGSQILMQESDHIGALQDAGVPLRQTINETDYDEVGTLRCRTRRPMPRL